MTVEGDLTVANDVKITTDFIEVLAGGTVTIGTEASPSASRIDTGRRSPRTMVKRAWVT